MQIDKGTVLQFLQDHGEGDKAERAKSELPDPVDIDAHADLLRKFGIDPQEFLEQHGGIEDIAKKFAL